MTVYYSRHSLGGMIPQEPLSPAELLSITTVAITGAEPGAIPRVAAFGTRKAAEQYRRSMERKLESYGIRDYYTVSLDSGPLDDQDYLSWIDEEFGEEETYYDE